MSDDKKKRLPFGRCLFSIFMGLAFSLTTYNYVLVSLYAPTSRRMFVLVPAVALAAMLGTYFLVDRWILPTLAGMQPRQKVLSLAAACLLGVFLMLAGTEAVTASPGSTILLLPDRTVEVSAPEQQRLLDPEVVLLFVKTSVGEVPLSSLEYQGWTLKKDQLVLSDFSHNSLRWSGKAGDRVAFIFLRSPRGGFIDVDWGGFTETVNLQFDKTDKYTYKHDYPVPFPASGAVVLFMAGLNLIVLSLALLLYLWSKRAVLLPALSESVRPLSPEEDNQVPDADTRATRNVVIYRWLAILAIILAALLLRIFRLDQPYVYIDELTQMVAAKKLVMGSSLDSVYQRGLFIVTLPVAFFIRIFGNQIWAAKLPGVLFNVLAIVPLYLIIEKVNRKAALLACVLFASNPWLIAVSRSVREYGYYPFYLYSTALLMIILVENIPHDLVITKDWRRVVNPKNMAILLVLVLLPLYGIYVDKLSTFKTILLMYTVFVVFLVLRLKFSNRSNILILVITLAALITLGVTYLQRHNYFIELTPALDTYPLRYFFPNPPQQWYFGRLAILFAAAFAISMVTSFWVYRRNFVAAFMSALFLVSILVFMLFFSRFIRPRYLLNVQFWFVPILGFGLAAAWSALQSIFPRQRYLPALMLVIVLAAGVNLPQVWMAASYDEPGVMPITDEYQYNFEKVEQFLLAQSQPGEVLVASLYGIYADWKGVPQLEIHGLGVTFGDQAQKLAFKAVKEHDTGWIVLDDRYDRGDWPAASFNKRNKHIEYIGTMEGQLVYKWTLRNKTKPTAP